MSVLYKPLIYEIIPGEPGTSSTTSSFGDGSGSVYYPPTAASEITLFIPVTTTAYYPGYGYGSTGIVTYEAVTVTIAGSSGGFRSPGDSSGPVSTTSTYTSPTPAQINTYFDRDWFADQVNPDEWRCETIDGFIPNYAQNQFRFAALYRRVTPLITPTERI